MKPYPLCNLPESRTHGMFGHPVYDAFHAMHKRCNGVSKVSRERYHLRGIRVCSQWRTFEAFRDDMLASWAPGLTLDRIDNERGYSPENCRWATRTVQQNNRSNTVLIETPRGPMSVSQAAREYGVKTTTLFYRIGKGLPPEELFSPKNLRTIRK